MTNKQLKYSKTEAINTIDMLISDFEKYALNGNGYKIEKFEKLVENKKKKARTVLKKIFCTKYVIEIFDNFSREPLDINLALQKIVLHEHIIGRSLKCIEILKFFKATILLEFKEE